jgi:hypothetical protein
VNLAVGQETIYAENTSSAHEESSSTQKTGIALTLPVRSNKRVQGVMRMAKTHACPARHRVDWSVHS